MRSKNDHDSLAGPNVKLVLANHIQSLHQKNLSYTAKSKPVNG